MTPLLACCFPSCTAFGVPVERQERQLCACCGRPLGGAPFGPAPGFEFEGWLGSGYYADVFRVVDRRSGAPCAAKLYAEEPSKRRVAERELAALRRLAHPRLPALRAWFDAGPWRVVAMELVEGRDLRSSVEAVGPLAAERVVSLGGQACEVLAAIADEGWTYRDLHPRNVHPDTPKGLMLLDLDNSRPPGAPAEPAGRAGYRAPELAGGGAVTPACDVFSLAGCMAFALTGVDPPERPGPLSDLRGRLGDAPALADLLDACRQAEPARRPSAAALRAALRSLAPSPDGRTRG